MVWEGAVLVLLLLFLLLLLLLLLPEAAVLVALGMSDVLVIEVLVTRCCFPESSAGTSERRPHYACGRSTPACFAFVVSVVVAAVGVDPVLGCRSERRGRKSYPVNSQTPTHR